VRRRDVHKTGTTIPRQAPSVQTMLINCGGQEPPPRGLEAIACDQIPGIPQTGRHRRDRAAGAHKGRWPAVSHSPRESVPRRRQSRGHVAHSSEVRAAMTRRLPGRRNRGYPVAAAVQPGTHVARAIRESCEQPVLHTGSRHDPYRHEAVTASQSSLRDSRMRREKAPTRWTQADSIPQAQPADWLLAPPAQQQ